MDKDYAIIFKNIKFIQEEKDKVNFNQETNKDANEVSAYIHDKTGISRNSQLMIKNLHSGQILSLKR